LCWEKINNMIEKVVLILAFAGTSLATTYDVNCTLMKLDDTEFGNLTIKNKTTAADNKAVSVTIKFKDDDATVNGFITPGLQLGLTETKPDKKENDDDTKLTAYKETVVKLTKAASQTMTVDIDETGDNKEKLYKLDGLYVIVSKPVSGSGDKATFDIKQRKYATCQLKKIAAAAKTDSGVDSLLNQRSTSLLCLAILIQMTAKFL